MSETKPLRGFATIREADIYGSEGVRGTYRTGTGIHHGFCDRSVWEHSRHHV